MKLWRFMVGSHQPHQVGPNLWVFGNLGIFPDLGPTWRADLLSCSKFLSLKINTLLKHVVDSKNMYFDIFGVKGPSCTGPEIRQKIDFIKCLNGPPWGSRVIWNHATFFTIRCWFSDQSVKISRSPYENLAHNDKNKFSLYCPTLPGTQADISWFWPV